MKQLPFSKGEHWSKGEFAFRIKLYTPSGATMEMTLAHVNEAEGAALLDLATKLCAGEPPDGA